MKKILISLFLFINIQLLAQDDYQLAIEYYNSKEYEKAEVLFDKVYKQRKAVFYFDFYIDCLIFQEKFREAEQRTEKEIKNNPTNYSLKVNLGFIYRSQGKTDEAENVFKNILKDLPKDQAQIQETGNSLIRRKELDWAEKVYQKGEIFFPGLFIENIAYVYSVKRKYDLMINAYMSLLETKSDRLAQVQSIFLNYLNSDVNNEFANLLEKTLIINIQNKGNAQNEEMLIWFYTQKAQYSKSIIYAIALDKRNNENGVRVYKIGEQAFENDDFSTANKAFTYVVQKGEYFPYFLKAKFYLLKALYKQVENKELTTSEQITEVENKYLEVIRTYSISNTIDIIVDLAHLQAFYLNKENDAVNLLNQSLEIKNLTADFKVKFLLELGNVYLHSNMPWDAVLTFAKIENNYPDNQLTDEAKIRKAKTYFYLQQFKWAKDQWDVLKGSPSKLIANDAIYWANFVKENTDFDSTYSALKKYSNADYLLYRGKLDQALIVADSIIKNYSSEPIVPFVYHLKYEIYFQQKDYSKAALSLDTIVQNYSYAMWSDKATFELARLYEYQLKDTIKAIEMYKKVLFDFQGSFYNEEARKKFRELSGS